VRRAGATGPVTLTLEEGGELEADEVLFATGGVEELIHSATIAVAAQVPVSRLWHAVPCFPIDQQGLAAPARGLPRLTGQRCRAEGASMPRARADSTASARLCALSLAYRLRRWVLTVLVDTDSSPAISGADKWVGR